MPRQRLIGGRGAVFGVPLDTKGESAITLESVTLGDPDNMAVVEEHPSRPLQ